MVRWTSSATRQPSHHRPGPRSGASRGRGEVQDVLNAGEPAHRRAAPALVNWRDVVLPITAAATVLAGCSPASVSGTPASTTTGAGSSSSQPASGTSYDSCTALTDASLTSLGLDPSTKGDANLGNSGDVASGCSWDSDDAVVSISVGQQTVDDYLKRTDLGPVRSEDVAGRRAAVVSTDATRDCGVAIDSTPVAVLVNVGVKFQSISTAGDPCVIATNIATKLAPLLPP